MPHVTAAVSIVVPVLTACDYTFEHMKVFAASFQEGRGAAQCARHFSLRPSSNLFV